MRPWEHRGLQLNSCYARSVVDGGQLLRRVRKFRYRGDRKVFHICSASMDAGMKLAANTAIAARWASRHADDLIRRLGDPDRRRQSIHPFDGGARIREEAGGLVAALCVIVVPKALAIFLRVVREIQLSDVDEGDAAAVGPKSKRGVL